MSKQVGRAELKAEYSCERQRQRQRIGELRFERQGASQRGMDSTKSIFAKENSGNKT